MVATHGYVTLAAMKSRIGITDTMDNTSLDAVIVSVSRWIDNYCGRKFYANTTENRYYTPNSYNILYIDDLLSVSTLGTDSDGDRTYEDTWATTDYDLMPYNAALNSKPYTWIETTPQGSYAFPAGVRKAVKITGVFGYCTYATAAPYEVREACYIQSHRIFKRKDSPFGIAGKSDLGQLEMVPKLDADVKSMLDPFVKHF